MKTFLIDPHQNTKYPQPPPGLTRIAAVLEQKGLKIEIAIELYLREEISFSRAAEMAGMDIESFKDNLKVRGLKVSSYIGSKEDIESGLRLI